jgi:CBS domain-containing protein
VFGSTSAYSNSAAAQPDADVVEDAVENVDTVGWGSTKVGTLLKAKGPKANWLWCTKDAMVIEAIKKMTGANVGSLMIVDCNEGDECKHKEDAVVGIMTERDYLTKVVVKGRNSSNTKVSDIMTPVKDLIMVTPKHSVLDVMELMVEKNFRHVPVVETCGTMTGMVSIKDVVHVMLKEHREEVGRLNEYIQGTF